ncbi:MAG: PhoU domain-containing protein [Halodesulfovibrio sp.]|uniref:PhoU domain-containing protein n=1 Tax=Halodesulfovibrio sp. TaxID=1912772 RepID=UPI00359D3893
MLTFEAPHDNFIFLLLEVQGQIDATQQFLLRPTHVLRQQISLCCDRTANMQAVIETKCYSKLHSTHALSQGQVSRLRAIQKMATHLHLISKFCVNITKQMHYLTIHSRLDPEEFTPFFTDIQSALKFIQPTLDEGSLSRALMICRFEHTIDEKYERVFSKLIGQIDSGKNASGHVTAIFIYRYLERIGDSLLRIGEALICITVGNTLKVSQFDSLQETLAQSGFTGSMHDVDYKAILGSRSGCCIGVVETMQPSETSKQGSIYKEGSISKIKLEKENIERWQTLFPALVPNIYGYHEGPDNAALLVELLHGCTLDEIILQADRSVMNDALTVLKHTVGNIWEVTRQDTKVPTNYIQQLSSRLSPVLKVHPSSVRDSLSVGGVKAFSTAELIQQCSSLEKSLTAPFSVLIHGDFNMNNIVYNSQLQTVRFIDLYRSRNFDYVQDTSVFLVSLFRLPIFEPQLRDRLNHATEQFYAFTRQFALDQNDATFETRLALALARSFYTSTRFELNQTFAKRMYMSAYYLMEKLLSHNNNWETFSLPEEILFY